MKVISVVGTKKTGKTTLVCALVASLARHGRVGTIKNMAGHSVDRGDTSRHLQAGADVVFGLGQARLKLVAGRISDQQLGFDFCKPLHCLGGGVRIIDERLHAAQVAALHQTVQPQDPGRVVFR